MAELTNPPARSLSQRPTTNRAPTTSRSRSRENTASLQTGAKRVEQELETIAGLTNIRSNLEEQRKVLKVTDKKKAASLGFTQGDVGQAISNALRGTRVGSVTLAGEQRDILVRSQAADEPSPSDIGNLELPVSQLQQQNAQKEASDKLTDKQKAFTDEQQRMADDATSDQNDELLKQQSKLEESRSDSLDQLRKTRHQLEVTQADLARLKANPPQPTPPNPTATPVPVTSDQLAQQRIQQWTQQVAQLSAAVTQTEKGIDQIEASIDQIDESLKQLDKQMDAADEQAEQTAEQRKKQEKLQDEQEALADVRAKPVKVKDVAKVQEVLAPTTVTQIEGLRRSRSALHRRPAIWAPSLRPFKADWTRSLTCRRCNGDAGRRRRKSARGVQPAGSGNAGGHRTGLHDHGRNVPQPGAAADLDGLHPVRCDRRGCRTADHRHCTRSARDGGLVDVDRNRRNQCDRVDRSDQSVPRARRPCSAITDGARLGCGRSS